MIENKFTTLSEEDALKFIELHLKEGFVVSASQDPLTPKIIATDHGFWPLRHEYLIIATKEE